jgi:hypothetical protein
MMKIPPLSSATTHAVFHYPTELAQHAAFTSFYAIPCDHCCFLIFVKIKYERLSFRSNGPDCKPSLFDGASEDFTPAQ